MYMHPFKSPFTSFEVCLLEKPRPTKRLWKQPLLPHGGEWRTTLGRFHQAQRFSGIFDVPGPESVGAII